MLAAASRGALRAVRTSLNELATEMSGAGAAQPSEQSSSPLAGVADELFSVVRLLDRSGQLRRALADPARPTEAKDALVDALLGEQLAEPAMRVLKTVVAQRWSSPRDMVDAVEVLAVQAAFLLAEADGSLDDVEDELFRFSRLVARDAGLRAVLTDRGLGGDRKTALLEGLLGERTRPETLRLVSSLVLAPRGRTLEDGLEEYARIAAEIRERSVARVVSAVRLTEAQEERLTTALGRLLGRKVQLQLDLDPGVIGGLVVRVGDEVIDGTIRHHLRAARIALASQ